METSLKAGFAQIFSCCPKNLSCPKFGGAAAPLAPPARTPMSSLGAPDAVGTKVQFAFAVPVCGLVPDLKRSDGSFPQATCN